MGFYFNDIIHNFTLQVSEIVRNIDVKLYQIPSSYISSLEIMIDRETDTKELLVEISEAAIKKDKEGKKHLEEPPIDDEGCKARLKTQVERLDKKFTEKSRAWYGVFGFLTKKIRARN